MHNSFDYEKQVPCSVGYFVITRITDFHRDSRSGRGVDCIHWFIEEMIAVEQEAMLQYFDEKRMIMTPADQTNFEQAIQCYYCDNPFSEGLFKVRDHDHVTGQYRGAACNPCNLLVRRSCRIHVFFTTFANMTPTL